MFELLSRLSDLPELVRRGIVVEQLTLNEIALSRCGHVIGVWRVARGRFLFIPAGYNEAVFDTDSLEEALDVMVEHLPAPIPDQPLPAGAA